MKVILNMAHSLGRNFYLIKFRFYKLKWMVLFNEIHERIRTILPKKQNR